MFHVSKLSIRQFMNVITISLNLEIISTLTKFCVFFHLVLHLLVV